MSKDISHSHVQRVIAQRFARVEISIALEASTSRGSLKPEHLFQRVVMLLTQSLS
jgi:hypothetical protein